MPGEAFPRRKATSALGMRVNRPSQPIDVLLRKVSSRRGLVLLGQFGIFLARKALRDKGFSIRDKTHRSYGSFLALKDKRKFLVEVKTRLKYKGNNQIKKRYKLDSGWKGGTYTSASAAEFHFKAKAYWVAVQIDIEKD